MESLDWPELALRLGLAMALGAMVGLDREWRDRAAGLRTMILVSLGSAAFTLAGVGMLDSIGAESPEARADLTRVSQGVIGGIGFLGAGSIIHSRGRVRGMTTAAAVWVTAGLGIASGLGLFALAGLTGVGAIVTLALLRLVEDRATSRKPARRRGDARADGETRSSGSGSGSRSGPGPGGRAYADDAT